MTSNHKPLIQGESRFEQTQLNIEKDNWNWCDPARYDGERPANWYEASLSRHENSAPLAQDAVCDVLVIGAGLLGASAALHLAEAGVDTILVDKHHVGSAASGRNGGQLTPGLARWEAADMIENLSHDDAKRLWRFASAESMDLIDGIGARYALDLDRKRGHVTAAVHPGHMSALLDGADARRHLGDAGVTLVGRHQLHDEYVRSGLYHGAAIDAIGGQIHPLALVRGLVHGFRLNGGALFEGTEVLELDETPAGVVATTPGGTITARRGVVLALHNTTFRLLDDGAATTVPFFTYVSVTAPLDVDVATLMPAGMPVYDTQFQIDYYRPVRGNRLLFGGQGTGSCWAQSDVNAYLLTRLNTVFPQHDGGFALDYCWSGVSDFTLNGATDSRKTDGRVPMYMVQGWSGHGVAQTVRIGKAICDDFVGRNDDFSMLTGIDHRAIPLGRQLSPIAIPAAKAAMSVMSALNPGRMISF
ncbi:NAD(P)/FAD-dependent oxidoreductase [Burkholderia semiarida]|uniref:NAD(P)/FAD-dependent oxidoreductase n=1 Tax=Burkholderia semiarida TaxID=2843303 RepID=A0ABW7L1Q9_9BURK|nr:MULTISPECIES: FAD-dependent oxidoreductase [Burkholderia]KWH59506.1 FAD-dependent oxidoreductase [Burkholderia anthina]MCA7972735.1 FAD-binding oxidoreductase [Burkholderia sp. AU39826]RQX81887.1 FAD-binding oxidoreductase [Burkholderia anthina]